VVRQGDLLGHPQQWHAAAGQDLRAHDRMRLDDVELARRERRRLQEDRVGDADLADVVEGRGALDRPRVRLGQAERAREEAGEPADATGVLAGVVVAVLGGTREALDDLEVRAVEGPRPLEDGLLELLLLALELRVQLPCDEQVADPEQRFDAVERLGEEVARAVGESSAVTMSTGR
jgi:hypothetical protein